MMISKSTQQLLGFLLKNISLQNVFKALKPLKQTPPCLFTFVILLWIKKLGKFFFLKTVHAYMLTSITIMQDTVYS